MSDADPSNATGEPATGDDQPPPAVARWGWRYHHVGIPTAQPRDGERHLAEYKMHVSARTLTKLFRDRLMTVWI